MRRQAIPFRSACTFLHLKSMVLRRTLLVFKPLTVDLVAKQLLVRWDLRLQTPSLDSQDCTLPCTPLSSVTTLAVERLPLEKGPISMRWFC